MPSKSAVATRVTPTPTRTPSSQLLTIGLSRINVRDEFNYRKWDTPEFEAFAEDVRRHGVLQPVLVKPSSRANGDFDLVAGERRYQAACMASMIEIPAVVRFDTDEQSEGLSEAIAENWFRADPNPIEVAQAFTRLLRAGWTRAAICGRYAVKAEELRQLLDLLDLPDDLQDIYAQRSAPLKIARPLAKVARVNRTLASEIYRLITGQSEARNYWMRPTTDDLVKDPAAVAAMVSSDRLPEGVFATRHQYPIERFAIAEQASKYLAEIEEIAGVARADVTVSFDGDDLEYATTISAAFGDLIIGQDTADHLAEVALARLLERAQQRAASSKATQTVAVEQGETEAQTTARRRAEREEARKLTIRAARFNHELAIHVERGLERVTVDKRVLKILSALNVNDNIRQLACGGARYGFRGWTRWETLKNGKDRVVYHEPAEAAQSARRYLAGATTLKQLAGRQLALVVMSMLADPIALPKSRRLGGGYRVSTGGETLPWSEEIRLLLAEIAIEHLPEDFTKELKKARDAAQAEASRRATFDAAVAAIETALKKDDLETVDAQVDVIKNIPRHSVPKHLRKQIAAARERLADVLDADADAEVAPPSTDSVRREEVGAAA